MPKSRQRKKHKQKVNQFKNRVKEQQNKLKKEYMELLNKQYMEQMEKRMKEQEENVPSVSADEVGLNLDDINVDVDIPLEVDNVVDNSMMDSLNSYSDGEGDKGEK
jgi:hypothetical protein